MVTHHHLPPYKHFACCRVSLPVAVGGIVVAGVASGLLVLMRRLSTEAASWHYPFSHMRPEADLVPLELAGWRLEVGCWRPKPVKWNISRHRGRQEGKRVSSVVACAGGPPCNLTLSYPVGEG